jgi:hypothetical protein
MKMRQLLIVLISTLWLTACGGGGSGGDSSPLPTPTPQPANPTATISFTASSGEVNTELTVANLTGSVNVDSWNFELNGVTGYVVVNGENVVIENGTVDVSSYASKDFQLLLNHDTAETVNVAVTSFTVDGKSYDLSDNQDITFTAAPVVTGKFDITVQAAGTGILVGNTTNSTPQEVIKGQVSQFLLRDLQAKFYIDDTLHSTIDLELTDGKQSLLPEVGDYYVTVSGITNLNGQDEIFSSTREISVTQGGSTSVGFPLTAIDISSDEMVSMSEYDAIFVNGDTKNITLSDIMQDNDCFMSIDTYHLTLQSNATSDIELNFLCQPETTFLGTIIDVNQYVQITFDAESMPAPIIYDINDSVHAFEVNTPLAQGTTIVTMSLGNVTYTGSNLTVTLKEPEVLNYGLYSPDFSRDANNPNDPGSFNIEVIIIE